MTVTLAVVVISGLVWWISQRARLGARVRSLAGVRLRSLARAQALLTSEAVHRVQLAILAGAVLWGVPGAGAGVVVGVAAGPLVRRRRAVAVARALDAQVPDVARAIASAMRGGANVSAALLVARDAARDPMRERLELVLRRMHGGVRMHDALGILGGSAVADALVHALRVGHSTGANLPRILDASIDALTEEARAADERHAATAQARLSAVVIGAMPFAFFALAGSTGRAQLRILFTEPVGWAVLTVGLSLQAVGVAWMRRLGHAA